MFLNTLIKEKKNIFLPLANVCDRSLPLLLYTTNGGTPFLPPFSEATPLVVVVVACYLWLMGVVTLPNYLWLIGAERLFE
jgi:hypothetical protein